MRPTTVLGWVTWKIYRLLVKMRWSLDDTAYDVHGAVVCSVIHARSEEDERGGLKMSPCLRRKVAVWARARQYMWLRWYPCSIHGELRCIISTQQRRGYITPGWWHKGSSSGDLALRNTLLGKGWNTYHMVILRRRTESWRTPGTILFIWE